MTSIPENLINLASKSPNVKAAVVCADQKSILNAINESIKLNLINPILIGKKNNIHKVSEEIDFDISKIEIINTESEIDSAEISCELAKENKIKIIIKGNLHTDILMKSYLKKDKGLLEGKRLSHIWHMTSDVLQKPLFITDGALNVSPRIDIKLHILKNVIEFSYKTGLARPKVAILSGTEDPIESMPSSIEAKQVMELAEREKLKADVYGPLALDNAISKKAADIKKINNKVAGNADVILVPNLETGNSLSKIMVYFMNACAAGIVYGGKVPIVVPSRADDEISKLASIAAAIIASQ